MAWTVATLAFPGKDCPATGQLPAGADMACLNPLTSVEPIGLVEGRVQPPWEHISQMGPRVLARLPTASCADCPVRDIPADGVAFRACFGSMGITASVAFPSVSQVIETVDQLGKAGRDVRLLSLTNGSAPARHAVALDLGRLTSRQLAALRVAYRLGYFRPGGGVTLDRVAGEMGLSRSTAHEHLQKGLSQMLRACFEG